MTLTSQQQFSAILEKAKQVLVFVPEQAGGDAIGSAWAMYFFLKKKNIEATIVVQNKDEVAERYGFLPQPENIMPNLAGARDFVLAFNTKYNKIGDVKTERGENELRIFITPEKGSIDPRDFSFIPAKFKYDLVITLGCSDKEAIGKVYEENPDVFYEVPVANIDCNGENDSYGQINIIEITAASVSEIVADIILAAGKDSIDETIAQCLLSGIIEATSRFQAKNTTPKSLEIAALLMNKGADQQNIIRYLYKTQQFHTLKLWGRVMARLNWEEDLQMIWAPVFIDDFVQSRSDPSDVPMVLDKIKDNYSAGKIFMVVFSETPEKIKGVVKCADAQIAKKISQAIGAQVQGTTCYFEENERDAYEAGQRIAIKLKHEVVFY